MKEPVNNFERWRSSLITGSIDSLRQADEIEEDQYQLIVETQIDLLEDLIDWEVEWLKRESFIKSRGWKDYMFDLFFLNGFSQSEFYSDELDREELSLFGVPFTISQQDRIRKEREAMLKGESLRDFDFSYFHRRYHPLNEFRGESFYKFKLYSEKKYGYYVRKHVDPKLFLEPYLCNDWKQNKFLDEGRIFDPEYNRFLLAMAKKQEKQKILEIQKSLYQKKVANEVRRLRQQFLRKLGKSGSFNKDAVKKEADFTIDMLSGNWDPGKLRNDQNVQFGSYSMSVIEAVRITIDFETISKGEIVYDGYSPQFFEKIDQFPFSSTYGYFEAESFREYHNWLTELNLADKAKLKSKNYFRLLKTLKVSEKELFVLELWKILRMDSDLLNKAYIDHSISLDEFRNHFGGGTYYYIMWKGTFPQLIYLFCILLWNEGDGFWSPEHSEDNQTICNHFLNCKGEFITNRKVANEKSRLMKRINQQKGLPSKTKEMDKIYKRLLDLVFVKNQ